MVDPDSVSGLFDGAGLLMTIYANGIGVPRNLAVAAHLACTGIWTADAEREGRVPHLLGLTRSGFTTRQFSPCDDITSGFEEGACAAHASRVAAVARSARIDAFARHLQAPAATRFTTLRTAAAAWARARSTGEIDQAGTDRGAVVTQEADMQTNDFIAMLARLQRPPPPALGRPQLEAAQSRMDATLRTLLGTAPDPDMPGAVTPNGIRSAQQAWIAYRAAWAAFAASAYPGWDPDGARAWVTTKRADMLAHLVAEPP